MSDERDPERDQTLPIATGEKFTHDLVSADVQERKWFGQRKYGVALQPSNGRDSLQDAYEEALDLVIYLKNELRFRRIEQASALREAAADYYGDDGPEKNPLSVMTWLKERADDIEKGS